MKKAAEAPLQRRTSTRRQFFYVRYRTDDSSDGEYKRCMPVVSALVVAHRADDIQGGLHEAGRHLLNSYEYVTWLLLALAFGRWEGRFTEAVCLLLRLSR